MGVVRGVARAVDDHDAAVLEAVVERLGRVRKTGRLDPPRICRTGWRTAPSRSSEAAGSVSASSSRRIVPAAAARAGQTGSAR